MSREIKIGSGMGTAKFPSAGPIGIVKRMRGPQDVLSLTKEKNLEGVIALVRGGTVAFAAPLLVSGVAGVIALEGAPETHLGIVAREMGVPCILSYTPEDESIQAMKITDYEGYIEAAAQSLDGKKVKLDLTGEQKEGYVQSWVYGIE